MQGGGQGLVVSVPSRPVYLVSQNNFQVLYRHPRCIGGIYRQYAIRNITRSGACIIHIYVVRVSGMCPYDRVMDVLLYSRGLAWAVAKLPRELRTGETQGDDNR